VELADAERRLEGWQRAADRVASPTPRDYELRNQLTVARLVTLAARERAESRGVHFRDDFPHSDEAHWRADLELKRTPSGEIEIRRTPIPRPAAAGRDSVRS
jgi:L-aspartate oxidase